MVGFFFFFSWVNTLFWLLLAYLFHHHVTAVACKRSRSFLQKCRWQVTAKHTCRICIHVWPQIQCYDELVHSCMVCTEHMLRWQQFSMVPAVQWPNSAVTTSADANVLRGAATTHSVTYNNESAMGLLRSREIVYVIIIYLVIVNTHSKSRPQSLSFGVFESIWGRFFLKSSIRKLDVLVTLVIHLIRSLC